jgi:carbon monoxide dehydrogenase subunit G
MRFRNAFDVPLPPDEAWAVLMDIQRIAPCMPGAALTEQVDERTYKGKVAVRLGPVALAFAGAAMFETIDAAARTAQVKAAGTDAKGRGGANALVAFTVNPSEVGSHVIVDTDLSLSGSVAQYGRGAGMIQEVAAQLIKQFAGALREQLKAEQEQAGAAAPVAEVAAPPAMVTTTVTETHAAAPLRAPARPIPSLTPATPISGFSLLLTVLWRSLLRLFGRRSET